MRNLRLAILVPLAVLPLVLGGCKKKAPATLDDAGDITPPSVTLQVAAIDPSFSPAEAAFEAEVVGSGFADGAEVSLNGGAGLGTSFLDGNRLRVSIPAMRAGSYDVVVTNPDGTRATLRKGLTLTDAQQQAARCSGGTVRFEFDSSALTADARRELDTLGACVRDANTPVRIEGHCDERGTTEYNIALGQRRADAVQRYLVGLGVSPSRLRTVSYGEERPVDRSGNDAAFAQNRRAEILLQE